ncbi:YaeQ family protein [Vogesella sp. LIG4]|uniref:YaeQ family protein n=1 Tax=Vogesella sp. LIG4 TaxID=1192162 RepID=UPI00081FADE3|nr:YaeQ family protein [Vogesella sp. LIG4]SCK13351.1 Uncharacterized conserved protein YaeQ, suppresses RfaH defect [Vogesella sp. LIG4]
MALKATIYKADLAISDMDRGYYASHNLTLAQHPSETIERMMLRIAVFALHADERLHFSKGISADDEPDLWRKNYAEEVEQWIELGEPDEKRMRQICSRADNVWVYSYGGRSAEVWWPGMAGKVGRFEHLNIMSVPVEALAELAALCQRSMQLTATIQDGTLWLSSEQGSASLTPQRLYGGDNR